MKTLFISLLLLYTLGANELQWVDEQINAIKPPREGISKEKTSAIKNPFTSLSKIQKESDKSKHAFNKNGSNTLAKKEIKLSLDAIINKSALINGKWYKLNDRIAKYTVSSIDRDIVLLSFKKKTLLLTTKTDNKNLKFKK